jgi:putative toxin-antitoxin system antitoxin component (TIGR02293 family)
MMADVQSGIGSATSASFYSRVGGKLGTPRIRSDRDLAEVVEKRLPALAIKALVRAGLSQGEAYQLIVPRRTLAHRIAKRQPLSREESDKAVRIARITAFAEQVFGEAERAWRWMRQRKDYFAGKTPLAMLGTEAGARLVEEMLVRIDDGMFA